MGSQTVSNRRVLVTGASGFIGSHLAECLLARGDSVVCLQHNEALPDFLQQAEVVKADLGDARAIESAMEGASSVFHIGGIASVADCVASPATACLVNTVGTLNIVEAARRTGAGPVILLSTSHVFGRPVRLPITEDHPLAPLSVYAASKLAADVLALGYFRSFGLPVTIIRPFNIYGPRQRTGAVIPSIIDQALSIGSVHVHDTTPKRDFLFVRDVVEALLIAEETPSAAGKEILLASGKPVSIGAVVREILTIVSGTAPRDAGDESAEDSADCIYGSPATAYELLGWTPRTDLQSGLNQTINWWRLHRKTTTEGK